MRTFRCLVLVVLAGFTAAALAQDQTKPKTPGPFKTKPKADTADVPPKADAEPKESTSSAVLSNLDRQLRLHMMEGSVVSGKLSVNSIMVDTEFGKLEVPVARIVSMTPGLDSHPKQRARIAMLIQQLGANVAAQREQAQKELGGMGLAIKPLLEPHATHKDPEVRKRVAELLEEIEQAAEDDEAAQDKRHRLINEDMVETPQFTVVGKISPQSFQVQTKFGPLTVSLGDIRRAEQETDAKPELRRTIVVSGQNLVLVDYKNSGIRVNRGDKVEVEASGRIVMSPWGSDQSSDPDGSSQFGQFRANIFGGALVGRIGTAGPEFKVGKDLKFTAQKSGILYFAVAMQAQFANRNYQFPGEYKVKVKVNPQ